MVLMARMWWRWPAFDRLPGVEIDAERGAEQRVLDVVDRERVARQQDVDVAGADQILEVADPPVCTTTGPATTAMRPPAASPPASSPRCARHRLRPGAPRKSRWS